jgi:hypothetical protein
MSIHLQKFIDRIQGFDARGSKDFTMSMTDAKGMHADISRLLLELQMLREQTVKNSDSDEIITVQMDGGKF